MLNHLKQLRTLLEDNKTAILKGDFSDLSSATGAIDGLTAQLEDQQSSMTQDEERLVVEVQNLAARNAGLLAASIKGANAAREKIEMIRRATSELHMYSSDGQVENVTPRQSRVEKRA